MLEAVLGSVPIGTVELLFVYSRESVKKKQTLKSIIVCNHYHPHNFLINVVATVVYVNMNINAYLFDYDCVFLLVVVEL